MAVMSVRRSYCPANRVARSGSVILHSRSPSFLSLARYFVKGDGKTETDRERATLPSSKWSQRSTFIMQRFQFASRDTSSAALTVSSCPTSDNVWPILDAMELRTNRLSANRQVSEYFKMWVSYEGHLRRMLNSCKKNTILNCVLSMIALIEHVFFLLLACNYFVPSLQ